MKRTLLPLSITLGLVLSLVLSLVPAAAVAAPTWSTADRARVERALSAYETVPARGELLKVHPAAHEILLDIVKFPASRRALARTRALAVLRHFPSRATTAALTDAMRVAQKKARAVRPRPSGELPLSLALVDLRQALTTYAVVRGPASMPLVKAYLGFPNPDVRSTAAEALRVSRSPGARAALLARQKVERSALVRYAITRQLGLLRRTKRSASGK